MRRLMSVETAIGLLGLGMLVLALSLYNTVDHKGHRPSDVSQTLPLSATRPATNP